MLEGLRSLGAVKIDLATIAEDSVELRLLPHLVPDSRQVSQDYLDQILNQLYKVGDWYAYAQTVLQSEDATYGYLKTLYIAWAPGQEAGRLGLAFQVPSDPTGRGMVLTTEPLELEAYGNLTYLKDYLKGGE